MVRATTDPPTEPDTEPTDATPTVEPTEAAPTTAPPTESAPPETSPPPAPPTTEPAPTTAAPGNPVPTTTAPTISPVPPPAVPPDQPAGGRLGVRATTENVSLSPAYWNADSTVTTLRVTVTNTGGTTERIRLGYTLPAGLTDAGTPGCFSSSGGWSRRCWRCSPWPWRRPRCAAG